MILLLGINFDLDPLEIPSPNFQRFLRSKGFFLFPDKTQKEKFENSHFNVSII